VLVTIDSYSYLSKKAAEDNMPFISSRIAYNVEDLTPEQLANRVTAKGNCWCPSVFKEIDGNLNRTNKNFYFNQYIAIDIDNTIKANVDGKTNIFPSPNPLLCKDAIEVLSRYNIAPSFVYTTFSDRYLNKYRLIWSVDDLIQDIGFRRVIYSSLMKILTIANEHCVDTGCIDEARLFFPGKEIVYKNYNERLNVSQLLISTSKAMYDADPNNSRRNKRWYFDGIGLVNIDGEPRIDINSNVDMKETGEGPIIYINGASPVSFQDITIYIKESLQSRQKKSNSIKNKPVQEEYPLIEKFSFNILEKACQLFNIFVNTNDHIDHYDKFRLFTNLLKIKGGRSIIEKGLERRIDNQPKKHDLNWFDNWMYQIDYIIKLQYLPIDCCSASVVGDCPYTEGCDHQKNLIETGRLYKLRIKEITKRNYLSVNEAKVKLEHVFKEVHK